MTEAICQFGFMLQVYIRLIQKILNSQSNMSVIAQNSKSKIINIFPGTLKNTNILIQDGKCSYCPIKLKRYTVITVYLFNLK